METYLSPQLQVELPQAKLTGTSYNDRGQLSYRGWSQKESTNSEHGRCVGALYGLSAVSGSVLLDQNGDLWSYTAVRADDTKADGRNTRISVENHT